MKGTADISSAGEVAFDNLIPLNEGNLVEANPDFYDGASSAQIDQRLRDQLGFYRTVRALARSSVGQLRTLEHMLSILLYRFILESGTII